MKKRNQFAISGPVLFEELEPRVLLSADLPVDVPAALVHEPDTNNTLSVTEAVAASLAEPEQQAPHELVFIDTNTPDYQLLVDDIRSNSSDERELEVILLDNSGDGITQVTEALSKYSELAAVHIISHGSNGSIDLGATRLEFDTLLANSTAIQGWSDAFSENGDLLIYGCNLAANADGQALVKSLARLTGADVAASDDVTGTAALNADWELEYTSGSIETRVVASAQAQRAWQGTLAETLWLSTDSNVGAPGADGLPGGWTEGQVLSFGGLDLTHGDPTDGDLSLEIDFDAFTLDPVDAGALHFVSRDLTVGGGGNTFNLKAGDVLVSFLQPETILAAYTTSGSNEPYSDRDLLVFRPNTVGNYTTGTFHLLLDEVVPDDLKGVTLVEQATTMGGTPLAAGSFLVISEASATETIDYFVPTGVGAGTTTGTTTPLIDIVNLGIDPNELRGIELVETATTVGGQPLAAGSLLATLNGPDSVPGVGGNNLLIDPQDVFVLNITATGDDTTAGTAAMFLDGSDVGLDGVGGQESPYALALANYSRLVVDTTSDASDGDVSSVSALLGDKGADGKISLREAIEATNATANGDIPDVIHFNIPDPLVGGTHTTLVGAGGLPGINDSVIIDGSTDPDYAGTPVIRIDGASAGANVDGLSLSSAADGSVVRGLMITRFLRDGLLVQSGADNITIAGNWIGTTGTGSTGVGNSDDGIDLQGSNATIGGTGANDRNVITNSGDEGIDIVGSGVTGHVIQGNYIGLDPDGATGPGNTDVGIAIISGSGNTIGGTTAAARNVISNNFEGIEINTADNVVQGNYIGTDATGALDRGNRNDDGVEVQGGGTGNLIGGTSAGAGNLIAFNALNGVHVKSGTGNTVLGNQIHSNSGIGIDLGTAGVTLNDVGDPDPGANNLQNYPVTTQAELSGTDLTLSGTLDTDGVSTQYRIEFFGNAAGTQDPTNGEGRSYLGSTTVITDGSGDALFSNITLTGVTLSVGDYVTATATRIDNPAQVGIGDALAYGNTSEFAQNVVVVAAGNNAPVANDDPGDFAADLLAQSPLSYWRLGETSGPAADLGSGANAGTYNGGTLGQTGAITGDSDTAVRFDAASSEYVEIAHSNDYLLDDGTVQLWFNVDTAATGDLQHLFSKDSLGFDTGGHLSIYLNASGNLEVRLQSASASYLVTSPSAVTEGQWHHVAFSFGADGMVLYLDGQTVDTDGYTGGLGTTSGGAGNFEPIAIGGGTQTSGNLVITPVDQFFTGLIDEVAIVGSQLNAETIRELYGAGLQHFTTDEDTALNVAATAGVLVNDFDVENDPLTVVEVNGSALDVGTPVVLASGAQVTLNADGSMVYDPNGQFEYLGQGQTATDTFTYTANDGNNNSSPATVTITITGVNDAPGVLTNTGLTVDEGDVGTVITTAMLNEGDIDDDGTELTYTITAVPTVGPLRLSGSALVNGSTFTQDDIDNNRVTYDHDDSENFADSFDFSLADGGEDGATAATDTFAITINPVNDNDPVADNESFTVLEGGTATEADLDAGTSLLDGDTDVDLPNDTLTVNTTPVVGPAHGALVLNANGTFSYTHDGSENFTDSFTYEALDANGGVTDTGSVSITITPLNDNEQVIATNTGLTVDEGDTGTVITQAMLETTDADNTPAELVYTVTTVPNPATGTLRLGGVALNATDTFTQADINAGLVTYDHNDSENFADSFDFSVDDGAGVASTGSFAITINPVNDNAPVITSDGGGPTAAIAIDENTTAVTDVDATDADGTTPTYGFGGGADDGFFTINPVSGVLAFSAAPDFETAADANGDNVYEVIVEARDGINTTQQAISVTVNNRNDAPANAMPGTQTIFEDTNLVFSNANGNAIMVADVDAGVNPIEVTLVANNGTVTLASSTGLTFAAGDGSADGSMTFTGTIANINTALNGLRFDPSAGFAGTARLRIVTDDLGNSGAGGPLSDLDEVAIVVEADTVVALLTDDPPPPPLDEILPVLTDDPPPPEPEEETPAALAEPQIQAPGPIPGQDLPLFAPVSDFAPIEFAELSDDDSRAPANTSLTVPLLVKFAPDGAALEIPLPQAIWTLLDDMKDQMSEAEGVFSDNGELVVTSAAGVTVTLSAGYVSWLLRAGYLSASLLSAGPLWSQFDPLPVLAGARKKRKKEEKRAKHQTPDAKVDNLFQAS